MCVRQRARIEHISTRIADRHSKRLLYAFVLVCSMDRMAELYIDCVCVCVCACLNLIVLRIFLYTNYLLSCVFVRNAKHECEHSRTQGERERT